MSILGNTASSYITPTIKPQWSGSKPCRFKGGRRHDNHPTQQLNHLLLGNDNSQAKVLGPSKRRIVYGETIGTDKPSKSHIKTFDQANKSKVAFSVEELPRLIKIPRADEYNPMNSPVFRHSNIGQSKMKKLQSGDLQSGIYRNFYKSQFKEQTHQ